MRKYESRTITVTRDHYVGTYCDICAATIAEVGKHYDDFIPEFELTVSQKTGEDSYRESVEEVKTIAFCEDCYRSKIEPYIKSLIPAATPPVP